MPEPSRSRTRRVSRGASRVGHDDNDRGVVLRSGGGVRPGLRADGRHPTLQVAETGAMTIKKIKIDGDKEIWVEVTEVPQERAAGRGPLEPASRTSEKVAAEATQTFEDALDTVEVITAKIHAALEKLITKPEKVTVELGVKFTAEAGVILAKGAVDANLKLTLSWSTVPVPPAAAG